MRLDRDHELSHESGLLSFTAAPAGTYVHGYDFSGATAFTGTTTGLCSGVAQSAGEDMEYVLVINAPTVSTDYRKVEWEVIIDANQP